jgi:hypothetical protein
MNYNCNYTRRVPCARSDVTAWLNSNGGVHRSCTLDTKLFEHQIRAFHMKSSDWMSMTQFVSIAESKTENDHSK